MIDMRPMCDGDLDWVAECERNLREFAWTRALFADSLTAGHLCRVLVRGECLLGYAVVMQVLDEAHLLIIGIAGDEQGRGLGGLFLDQLCQHLKENGALQMFLEVGATNERALRLYARQGFAEIGRRKAYYPAAGATREDAIVMKKTLC